VNGRGYSSELVEVSSSTDVRGFSAKTHDTAPIDGHPPFVWLIVGLHEADTVRCRQRHPAPYVQSLRPEN